MNRVNLYVKVRQPLIGSNQVWQTKFDPDTGMQKVMRVVAQGTPEAMSAALRLLQMESKDDK